MKAFKVSRANYQDTEDLKVQSISSKEDSLNIFEQNEFCGVAITNPEDSNRIFLINNINLLLKNKNNLKLMMGESKVLQGRIKKLGSMCIAFDAERSKNIELATKNVQAEKPVNMIEEEVIILLPGGGVFIEANNPMKELKIKINWIEEKM